MSGETSLVNYPAGGIDGTIRTVHFGAASDDLNLLISYNSDDDGLEIVIGNGPTHSEVPSEVPILLRSVANIIESLSKDPEYAAAVAQSENASAELYPGWDEDFETGRA